MSKRQYMWGAWTEMRDAKASWLCDEQDGVLAFFGNLPWPPVIFGIRRKDIMPQILKARKQSDVLSCIPVKVPIPKGPGIAKATPNE